MTRLLTSFALLFLILAPTSQAQTGWYLVPIATSANLYSVASDPFHVEWLAGDNGTAMKSTNNGDTWVVSSTGSG